MTQLQAIDVIVSEVPSDVARGSIRLLLTVDGYETVRLSRRGNPIEAYRLHRDRDQAHEEYMLAKREGIVYCTFEGLPLPEPIVAQKMAVGA